MPANNPVLTINGIKVLFFVKVFFGRVFLVLTNTIPALYHPKPKSILCLIVAYCGIPIVIDRVVQLDIHTQYIIVDFYRMLRTQIQKDCCWHGCC